MNICDYAYSLQQDRLLTCSGQGNVDVRRLGDGSILRSFSSNHGAGGSRICLHPSEPIALIGGYRGVGLAAHNIESGDMVWNAKKPNKIQSIRYARSLDAFFVGVERKPLHVIKNGSFETLSKMRGAMDGWPFKKATVYALKNQILVENSTDCKTLKTESFGILSAVSDGESIFVSVACGPILKIDPANLTIADEIACEEGHHYINLFLDSEDVPLGLYWNYEEGGPTTIINLRTRETVTVMEESFDLYPISGQNRILLADGTFYSW